MKDFFLNIFGNKKKFIRLFLIICVIAAVICYGFYSKAIKINVNKNVEVSGEK
jgi:uncharacterized membrane protein YuzA (DUF378 family)